MARPRVFISSTFYDLKQVRSDLERFIKELGYESVRNERGQIPYGKEEKIEQYAYREVEKIDILVAVIGGRFGSESQHSPHSITQMEIKTALDRGKQVYLFIDREVYAEFRTYSKNKDLKDFTPAFADDVRIFEFIEFLETLPKNNPIATFSDVSEIVDYLREQWAGLFHSMLVQYNRIEETDLIKDINESSRILKRLVLVLSEDSHTKDEVLKQLSLVSHPLFDRLKQQLWVPYRVYFTNYDEMVAWLGARQFAIGQYDFLDDDDYRFKYSSNGTVIDISIAKSLFDEYDRLKPINEADWDETWVRVVRSTSPAKVSSRIDDDDLPF